MDLGGASWVIIDIIAVVLLAGVLLFAVSRNRKTRPRDVERSEAATREVYREEEEARRTGEDRRA